MALAATVLIQPLAWEPPNAAGAAQEMVKRQKKKKKKSACYANPAPTQVPLAFSHPISFCLNDPTYIEILDLPMHYQNLRSSERDLAGHLS